MGDYAETWGKVIELLETISTQLECLNNRVDMINEELGEPVEYGITHSGKTGLGE